MEVSNKILSDITVYMKYAKYIPQLNRRETWEELVTRNKNMHIKTYPDLKDQINAAYKMVSAKKVLPSMRSMQFAGMAIEVNPSRMFNCSYLPVTDIMAFSETMFLLLSGCGVGYSVQSQHVEKLPEIRKPLKSRRYFIQDSIEGWSEAIRVLMKSFLGDRSFPLFDYRGIREKGSRLITSGGKAPGAEPLKVCLNKIETLLRSKKDGEKLDTIDCHDIQCIIADAVLAGGIRRSALISLFSIDDLTTMRANASGPIDHEEMKKKGLIEGKDYKLRSPNSYFPIKKNGKWNMIANANEIHSVFAGYKRGRFTGMIGLSNWCERKSNIDKWEKMQHIARVNEIALKRGCPDIWKLQRTYADECIEEKYHLGGAPITTLSANKYTTGGTQKMSAHVDGKDLEFDQTTLRRLETALSEDMPATSTAGVATVGIPLGKPPKSLVMKKFAGLDVFAINPSLYPKSNRGKKKYDRYSRYVGEDEAGEYIRCYARKYPNKPIIVMDSISGCMQFLRHGFGK